jgi:hypothetical protein
LVNPFSAAPSLINVVSDDACILVTLSLPFNVPIARR